MYIVCKFDPFYVGPCPPGVLVPAGGCCGPCGPCRACCGGCSTSCCGWYCGPTGPCGPCGGGCCTSSPCGW
ncbi:hypothetical protein KR215_002527 [Drosophila sulfurigaster]|nr:hypothetical protein KR215_002527 [Drosophila sulfurigaster]